MSRTYSRSGMEHFCTRLSKTQTAALVSMARDSAIRAEQYRRAEKARTLWDLMRDHRHPQQELPI